MSAADAGAPAPADLARWRTAERERLRAARLEIGPDERADKAQRIARNLDELLAQRFGSLAGFTISGYWPIKAEFDLRFWLEALRGKGVRIALPVVELRAAPLVFREWQSGARMERGHWNIPVPPADAPRLVPRVALAPVVGWDGAGYRLGYGGGYFDRTLAALDPRPFTIGVGLQAAQIDTIHPQPHDKRLNAIVTEAGLQWEDQP